MRRNAIAIVIAALLASGCPSQDRPDDILASGEKLYSQFDEELVIRHFFGDRRGGFFLDVGAFHYKRFSTTYYLEKHLGWSGIALDALPFGAGYEQHRPRTRFFQYIVADRSGEIATLHAAGAVSSTDAGHLRDLDPEGEVGLEAEETQVETITLDDLLDREGVTAIDFLSMDIEGGEPAALAGFDIERFHPELVCIEAFPTVRDAIAAYFAEHGYVRIDAYLEHDSVNWYYTPAE